MSVYAHLVLGQSVVCSIEGERIMRTRYNASFWRFLSEYKGRKDWSFDRLCKFRDARLRQLIHHAYQTVPYYRDLFDDGGINPDSIRTLDDLKKLPLLAKEMVSRQPERFCSSAVRPEKRVTAHTSGTNGQRFVFSTTNSAVNEQWSVWWRYRRALGIQINDLYGLLGGRSIVPIEQRLPHEPEKP